MNSKTLQLVVVLIGMCCLIQPSTALASRPVRCNGRVQFRPCVQPIVSPGSTGGQKISAPRTVRWQPQRTQTVVQRSKNPNLYARVTEKYFKKLSSKEGLWTGKIQGNGNVQLNLQWFKAGVLQINRSLGSIKLSNKASSFGLRSTVPAGLGWSWDLQAVASEIS